MPEERRAIVLQGVGGQRLKAVPQAPVGVVEQCLSGSGELRRRRRASFGDLAGGEAAHDDRDDNSSRHGNDGSGQKIDIQLQRFSLRSADLLRGDQFLSFHTDRWPDTMPPKMRRRRLVTACID